MAEVHYPGPGAIAALAAALNAAQHQANEHPGDPAFTGPFHAALGALYSPEWEAVVEGARQGETWAFAPAIDFLEADPHCFRSGYYKERLCRYLSRGRLTLEQRHRLASVATRVLAESGRPQRERKAWGRLASAVAQSP